MIKASLLLLSLFVTQLAIASTPPLTYSSGVIGKEVMLGDFPSDQTYNDWYLTPLAHGDDSYAETLSTVHFSSLTSVSSAVDYAELRLTIHTYSTSPAVPAFKIYARKAVSPTAPDNSNNGGQVSNWPSVYYNSGAGWTTAYVTFTPTNGDTGLHRLDVTAIVNELAAQSGGTGTSITFILEPVGSPNGTSAINLRFTAGSTLKIYEDLDDRDYQRHAIAGGHAIFYWPFDATDLATTTSIRSVVDGTDASVATADLGNLPMSAASGDYAMDLQGGVSELEHYEVTELLAPYDSNSSTFCWPVKTHLHDYLVVLQYVQKTSNTGSKVLWDLWGDAGFVAEVYDNSSGHGYRVNGGNADPAVQHAYSGTFYNQIGAVKTMALFYDNDANQWYVGYNNGSSGWNWQQGISDTGSYNTCINGIQTPVGKIQGLAAFEFQDKRRLAEVKLAVERARTLWASGVKALPPMLF